MYSSNKLGKIKREISNNRALTECAKQCGVFGDLTTLKICYLLRYYPDLNVTSIAELIGTSISNVSHCLAKLKKGNIVEEKRLAQTRYYSLKDDSLVKLLDILLSNNGKTKYS